MILAGKCEIVEENQVEWIIKRIPEKLQLMISTLGLASVDINVETIRNVLNTCQIRGIEIEHIGAAEATINEVRKKRKSNGATNTNGATTKQGTAEN